MKNVDLKFAMMKAGVRQYEVAQRYGLNESNFCRLMRNELPQEKKDRIYIIIEDIRKEHEREGVTG